MGTKNNPGKYDCYHRAEGDEPMFVLLGRDPAASVVVTFWRSLREKMGLSYNDPKSVEARECAFALERYARAHHKDVGAALEAFRDVILDAADRIRDERKRQFASLARQLDEERPPVAAPTAPKAGGES